MTTREALWTAAAALSVALVLSGCCRFGAGAATVSTTGGGGSGGFVDDEEGDELVDPMEGDAELEGEPEGEAEAETVEGASTADTAGSTEETEGGAATATTDVDDGGESEGEGAAEEEPSQGETESGETDADSQTEADAAAAARAERRARAAAAAEARRSRRGTVVGTLSGSSRFNSGTIVYVEGRPGRPSRRTVTMDQRNHRFIPSVLPIVRGTTVRFLNNDNEAHNVFSPDNEGYDLGNWVGGESRTYRFQRAGVYTQLCQLHPSMIGYIVVLESSNFTRVRGGRFQMELPPGTYQLTAWHPRGHGTPVSVTVRPDEEATVEIAMSRGH